MFCYLGPVPFEPVNSPSVMDFRREWNYAEHPLIENQPGLQLIGATLATRRLTVSFRAENCDPAYRVEQLESAADSGEPLDLVLGDGTVLGKYVIVELSGVTRRARAAGKPSQIEVEICLKEYVPTRQFTIQTPPTVQSR